MAKLIVVFHLALLCASAGMIVSGSGPMGMLADASISIPLNPNSDPVPAIRDSSDGSWSGMVTVFGGTGQGYLYFDMIANAESFSGSPTSEYMDSYSSATSSAGSVFSQPWLPEGSTPTDCEFCAVRFTFGVPQEIDFSAHAYVSYSFYPMVPGIPPYLAGDTIRASVQIGVREVATAGPPPYFLAQFDPTQSYSVVFGTIDPPDPVPEPESVWSAAAGLVTVLLVRLRPLRTCWYN